MGHEILLLLFNFFQDHNFPLFVASSQESQMTQWNDKNFKMFTFVFCSFAVAPQIRPVPQSGRLVVHQGEAATLGCDILKGTPTPEITWKRKVRNFVFKSATQHSVTSM